MLYGDGCHQSLRAITSGHPQAVGATGDGIASQLFEVESAIEHDDFNAEVLSQFDETELCHLAPTRPRVANQHRALRTLDGQRATLVMFMKIA